MLPSMYRMHCSEDFRLTVKYGRRSVQQHLILYSYRVDICQENSYPHVGLIISKHVGNSVQRHRVARQLRHVMRSFLADLSLNQYLVIRVRPGSSTLSSQQWHHQIQLALSHIRGKEGR